MLEIRHLKIGFRRYRGMFGRTETCCVSDISIDVAAGELLAVVGASGVGKSLLAHAVLGVLPRNAVVEGDILFEQTPLCAKRVQSLRGRQIALVPQSTAYLDPLVRNRRQVSWAARRAGAGAGAGELALGRYGLDAKAASGYPHMLSGGMARRVLLAISTVADAKLIIADEPTSGLDATNIGILLTHLRSLADAGKAVVVITHDLSAVIPHADRVALMRRGESVETVDSAMFCSQHLDRLSPYARALWNALPQNGFTVEAAMA